MYAAFSNINLNRESEVIDMATSAKPTESAEPTKVPNLEFKNPWKGTFRFEKVKTVKTAGIDGSDFFYPLCTVTVVAPGTTGLTAGDRVLIHAYPETLIAELRRVKPQAGTELTIDYQGKAQSKAKRDVHVFEIDSPDTADVDWDNPGF